MMRTPQRLVDNLRDMVFVSNLSLCQDCVLDLLCLGVATGDNERVTALLVAYVPGELGAKIRAITVRCYDDVCFCAPAVFNLLFYAFDA